MAKSKGEKSRKNCHISIFGLKCVAKKKSRWTKICISHLVYSHIWLNLLTKEDCLFFLHPPMDDHHFDYKQKFLKTKIKVHNNFLFSWQNSPKSEIIYERLENQVILEVFNGQKRGEKIAKITIFPYLV